MEWRPCGLTGSAVWAAATASWSARTGFSPLPMGSFEVNDPDLCMECGACARNCPVQALTVSPGVGCAVAILAAWVNRLLGRKVLSGCC